MKKLLSMLSTSALLIGNVCAVANTSPKTLQASEAKNIIDIDKSVANWHIQTKPLDFVIKGKWNNGKINWEKSAEDYYKEIIGEVSDKYNNIDPHNYPTTENHKREDLKLNVGIKNLSPEVITSTMNDAKPTIKSYELDWSKSKSDKARYNLYPSRKYVNLIYQFEDEHGNHIQSLTEYEEFVYFINQNLKNFGYILKTANDYNTIAFYDFKKQKELKTSEELQQEIGNIIRSQAEIFLQESKISGSKLVSTFQELLKIEDDLLLPNFSEIAENNINNLRSTGKNGYINSSWLNFKFQLYIPSESLNSESTPGLHTILNMTMDINLDGNHDTDRSPAINPYHDDFSPYLKKLSDSDYNRSLESKSILNTKYIDNNIGKFYPKFYNNEDFYRLVGNMEEQLRYQAVNRSKHAFDSLLTPQRFESYEEMNSAIRKYTFNKVNYDGIVMDIKHSTNEAQANEFKDALLKMYNMLSKFMPDRVLHKLITDFGHTLKHFDSDPDFLAEVRGSLSEPGPWNKIAILRVTKGSLSKSKYYKDTYASGVSVSDIAWYMFFHHFGTLFSGMLSQEKALNSDYRYVDNALELKTINHPMYQLQNEIYKHFSPITHVNGVANEDLPIDGFSNLYSWLVVDSAWGRTYDDQTKWFGEAFAKWLLTEDNAKDKSWEILNESFIRTLTNYWM